MLDGRQAKLSDLLGQNNPVIIELWATWCFPCRRMTPLLTELSAQYREQGLTVIGLTIEKPDKEMKNVREYVREHKISYPIAFSSPEINYFLNGGKGRPLVPTVFVFAPDGSLVKQVTGYSLFGGGTKGKMRKAVEQAMRTNNKESSKP